MASLPKNFKLRADQIKPIAKGHGTCVATDMITVRGPRVGFMYRQEPTNRYDSEWTFTAGIESQEYMDFAGNHAIYDVNTIANYDPDIISFLEEPVASAYERDQTTGLFPVNFEPPD